MTPQQLAQFSEAVTRSRQRVEAVIAIDNRESLPIANPSAIEGIGAPIEWLGAQAKWAIVRGGSALTSFKNYNGNEGCFVENRSVLIRVDEWMAAEIAHDDLPAREGACILGVDLGAAVACRQRPSTGPTQAVFHYLPCHVVTWRPWGR